MCFALDPCVANDNWVREFYDNLIITSFTNLVMTIRERQVNFRIEQINEVYGLPNANMEQFHAKACTLGTWMGDILCAGKKVPWATTKRDILMNHFTAEARLWLNINCSRVSPCTHMTIVTNMQARTVAYLLSSISLNMGEIMYSEWRYFRNHRGTHLLLPSFIIELHRRVQVKEYDIDT